MLYILWVPAAGLGIYAAIKQSLLQRGVLEAVDTCMPSAGYLLETAGYLEGIGHIFRGASNCPDVQAAFLGLSIPEWSLANLLVILVLAIAITKKTNRE